MNFRRRVSTIYRKELIDILRDRRTLIAMIVVPIVLYPLLMLGSIQAVSHQAASLDEDGFVIGVLSDRDWELLKRFIRLDARRLENKEGKTAAEVEGDAGEEAGPSAIDLETLRAVRFDSEDALEAAVQERAIQVGVVFAEVAPSDAVDRQTRVQFKVDEEEIRSARARGRLVQVFERVAEWTKERRLEEKGLPPTFVDPFVMQSENLSAPSSVLGQILPLILVLMTITGAIYPAIDLTAGERERNTLESLMVCPVPVLELIVGKFLVVTTVAIMGATLNLSSVTATVYLGGFKEVIASEGGAIPFVKMLVILVSLVPFAVLMSAIMIAVCSYARTFKEAQNYVTPVIIAVLIPGGIAALPATKLEGMMLVMPVGNMVLFARDMLLGADVEWWRTVVVLLSTTLYASAAVAIAANVFGKESVVFADAASLSAAFSRRLMKPQARPSVSMALLVVALLFPTWHYVQTALQPTADEGATRMLLGTGLLMPLLFVVLPWGVLSYWKVNVAEAFGLRRPGAASVAAALLIGLSSWILAHEVSVLQSALVRLPPGLEQSNKLLEEALSSMPGALALLLLAVVPAVSEELLFRGFLMSGLSGTARKWTCILVTAAVFGTYHVFIFRLPITIALGAVLGYVCWQSRSVVPGMIVHLMHNGLLTSLAVWPVLAARLGLEEEGASGHMPAALVGGAVVLFAAGLVLARRAARGPEAAVLPAAAADVG